MKRIVLLFGVLVSSSCQQQQLQEQIQRQSVEIASLKTQLDDCRTKSEGTTQAKAVITETVREVESMLKRLAAEHSQQDVLRAEARELTTELEGTSDPSVSQRDLLRNLVQQIADNQRELMRDVESANKKLTEAQRQLASAGRDAQESYERRLQRAQKTIVAYADANKQLSDELEQANEALRNAKGRIVELEDIVKATERVKEEVEAEAHRLAADRLVGHWVSGGKRDLTSRGVLRRANRFSRSFCPRCSNCSSCTTLAVSDGMELPINAPADKVEVMTEHPDDSFGVQSRGNGQSAIVIRKAESFWGYGKCLIVAIN